VGIVRDKQRGLDAFAGWATLPELKVVDLVRPGAARSLIADVRPSAVFNLAGYGVDRNERDETLAEQVNHDLVRELATACAPSAGLGGPRLIHVGSALEYGTATGVLGESTVPQPTTLYGRTKLAGTRAITMAAEMLGTNGVTARLFTVFGAGEHDGRLFPSLVHAAQTGASLPLTEGRQRRDFAWAGDVAELLVDLSMSSFEPGAIVNLASGQLREVAEFVRECALQLKLADEQLHFGAVPARAEEMWHDGVDVSTLRELVGRAVPADLARAVTKALQTPLLTS
jgi:nucleoside-diphosphate-sugar epimerase